MLFAAAVLIVMGIFNALLEWEIFGPKVEAVLYGVFFSSIALAGIGVAMTFVIGFRDIVLSIRVIERKSSGNVEESPELPKWMFARRLIWILVALVAVITVFAGIDSMIQTHRSQVFKRLASRQIEQFDKRLIPLMEECPTPPQHAVPVELFDVIRSMNELDYISSVELYMKDPADPAVIWKYRPYRVYKIEEGFNRCFASRDWEKAISEAFNGSSISLDNLNRQKDFFWYHAIGGKNGGIPAILKIQGNSKENFREYPLGK